MIKHPFRLSLAALLCCSVLSGCSSFPDTYDELPDTEEVGRKLSEAWSAIEPISRVRGETGFHIELQNSIPAEVLARPMSFRFVSSATLKDLAFALSAEGHMTSVDEELGLQPLKIPFYSGTMGGALAAITAAHDISVEYRSGVLLFAPSIPYTVTVPQNSDLVARLTSQMIGLGAVSVQGDVDTGVISYTATPKVNEIVTQYIRRAARNAAMVKLQIAVVDLRLNRDLESGFDWSKFVIETTQPPLKAIGSVHNTDLGIVDLVGQITNSGASVKALGRNFNIGLAMKALSRYGQARTDQDLVLSTLSGSLVNIKSGTKIPYVDNIGTTSNERSSMQSVQTATVDSGLTVKVLPYFDVDAEMVTTKIDVELSSLVAFRDLSAGEGLGSISQPEMQETTFSNITRLSPGETAVLGGIAYDQVDENYTSIAGMENTKTGSKVVKTNRHAMFIMIRPTVVTFNGRKLDADALELKGPANE